MSKAPQPPHEMNPLWEEVRENVSTELIGLLLFLVGGALLFSLASGDSTQQPDLPWLVGMVGWTAPFVAVAVLILGGVLMLGPRAGYWSAEAIVGAQLLLLSLQAGTFAWANDTVTWRTYIDGANGGLVGWSFGSLLVAALGQWPALLVIAVGVLMGSILLARYTPLIYAAAYLVGLMPRLGQMGDLFGQLPVAQSATANMTKTRRTPAGLPQTNNFVLPRGSVRSDPVEPVDGVVVEASAPPDKVSRARQTSSVQAVVQPLAEPKPKGAKTGVAKTPTAVAVAEPKPRAARAKPPGPLPGFDLLNMDDGVIKVADVRALQQLIESTLADFNVPVRVVHVESGPTVTQFGVEPLYLERGGQRRKVRVNRIVNLADDLALALAAPAVRIEAPVPGRPYVGIEVPNVEKTRVTLRGIMESKTLAQEGGRLALPLGRNTSGAPVVMDLTRAPHMLIAGATGAGKSVCINTIVTGLLMQHGPESLRFVMVDPKMVELPGYNGIPHLLGKVITEMDQVMGALTWLLLQMDDRYRLFQQVGVRNVEAYNALAQTPNKGKNSDKNELTPLPYIVLIIDELADLMMTSAEDIERQICRLAQMARATGIHLILATQRPSVDVVTGLIKANFPTRIAFSVTSQTDSRVILDTPGAERLLGRGDMLMMRPDAAKLFRIQGCFVADDEIARIVSFWKAQAAEQESEHHTTVAPWTGLLDRARGAPDDEDELFLDAIDIVRGLTTCSTSLLQRKLHVGYPKAAQLMDQLAAKGFVGPDLGGGQGRAVLLKSEEVGEPSDEE